VAASVSRQVCNCAHAYYSDFIASFSNGATKRRNVYAA
jgi:hypothetical protein